MVYEVFYENEATKDLNKLDASVSRRIIKKIDEMSISPSSCDIKKLKSSKYYRLRVGDYRIIFTFENNIIKILKIGNRQNIYR